MLPWPAPSFPFFLAILFTYFWLCWIFVAVRAFSAVAASKGYSPVGVCGLLIAVPSLVEHRFQGVGASVVAGSRSQAPQLWHTGWAAPRDVGSSRTRDLNRSSCVSKWIPHHWATREAPFLSLCLILEPRCCGQGDDIWLMCFPKPDYTDSVLFWDSSFSNVSFLTFNLHYPFPETSIHTSPSDLMFLPMEPGPHNQLPQQASHKSPKIFQLLFKSSTTLEKLNSWLQA